MAIAHILRFNIKMNNLKAMKTAHLIN